MAGSVTSHDLKDFIEKYVADYPEATGEKDIWRCPVDPFLSQRPDLFPYCSSFCTEWFNDLY